MSLFGSTAATQPAQSTGLFGASQNQNQQQRPTLSLFSSNPQSTASAVPGLFSTSQPQQQSGTGLFNTSTQQKPTLSLFGGSAAQQPQPATSTGLFGAAQSQPQQTQQQQPQQQQPSGLFGGFGAAQQQQQQPQQQTGLFGSVSGSTGQQPQQAQPGLFGSIAPGASLSNNTSQIGASVLGKSSIWTPGSSITPREKSVPDQMQILAEKWHPESTSCPFSQYFYNRVPEEALPYYAPGPNEDATQWEEALKNKPSGNVIPVLAKGPLAVGRRLEVQALTIRALQVKLHELNDVLTKRLQAHDLQYSVRAQEARRKHVVLSRRCLALATKAQVLRNRGYALDGTEEQLRMKLNQLEKMAFDPMLSGRQEEIWAKMSVLRDRAQILKAETERLAKDMSTAKENPLDDEQMKKIEKLLGVYEMQLNQLKKERETAEKDLDEWQGATQNGIQSDR